MDEMLSVNLFVKIGKSAPCAFFVFHVNGTSARALKTKVSKNHTQKCQKIRHFSFFGEKSLTRREHTL